MDAGHVAGTRIESGRSIAPAVSVLMPLFDQEEFVPRAVESLFAQTLADWELLVVDDGSRDGSAAAVGPYLVGGDRRDLCMGPTIRVRALRSSGRAPGGSARSSPSTTTPTA